MDIIYLIQAYVRHAYLKTVDVKHALQDMAPFIAKNVTMDTIQVQ